MKYTHAIHYSDRAWSKILENHRNQRLTPGNLDIQGLKCDIRHSASAGVVQSGVFVADGSDVCSDVSGLILRCWEVVGEPTSGKGRGDLRGNTGATSDRGDAEIQKTN